MFVFASILLVVFAGLIFPQGAAHAGVAELLAGTLLNLITPVIYIVFFILFYVAYVVAWFGASMINMTLNPAIINSVLNIAPTMPLYQSWVIFRDIANLLFILILLLIALGTIFQSDSYNIKKSLPRFIIVVFMINFSIMITGLVIDFGNTMMYGILRLMCPVAGGTCFQDFYAQLMGVIDTLMSTYKITGALSFNFSDAVAMAIATIYTFIYGLVLLALGVFLLIRIAALALLIIISPLAMFGHIAPGLKGISDKWWTNLVQYSLFGPIFALMLYVSGLMMMNTVAVDPAMLTTNPNLGSMGPIFVTVLTNIIPLIFLLAIIPITQSMGIAGAGAIMGATVLAGTGLLTSTAKFAGGYASDTWGRYVARGAGAQGQEGPGAKAWISRRYAGVRRIGSNFSPTAIRNAYKAKKANDAHDYDVATGKVRNKMEAAADPYGAAKDYYKKRTDPFYKSARHDYQKEAEERKANESWKDKGINNSDDAQVAAEEGRKTGTMSEAELKIAVKFQAAEGGIDAMLDRSTDNAGNAYGAGPEGLIKYVDATFKRLSDEEKSKLLASIAKAETKNGNTTYEGLGISDYNAGTKRVEYKVNRARAAETYIDPKTNSSKVNPATGINYTEQEAQIEAQVKAANKKDVKDLKKSSFIEKNVMTGVERTSDAGVKTLADMKGTRQNRIKTMDRDRVEAINKSLNTRFGSYAAFVAATAALPLADPNKQLYTDLVNTWTRIKADHPGLP